jgi:hypothetical protein
MIAGNECSVILKDSFGAARGLLDAVMGDATEAVAHWKPAGSAHPVGATYAHVVIVSDGFVNGLLREGVPLFASGFAGRTGVSENPPMLDPRAPVQATYHEDLHRWAHRVKIDLPVARAYGAAVCDAIDGWLSTLSYADLGKPVDLSGLGIGISTLGWVLHNAVVSHIASHAGEIAAIKGLQGLKGYPF